MVVCFARLLHAAMAVVLVLVGCSYVTHDQSAYVRTSFKVALMDNQSASSGEMIPVYDDATTSAAKTGRALMQQTNMLELFTQDINSVLALPFNVPLRGTQCGEANLFWNPNDRAIEMCYENAARLLKQFTELGYASPESAAFNAELLGFYHESGHMVIDIYDLPAVGREEDDADQVSAYMMLRPNADGSVDVDQLDAIGDAARSYAADADQPGALDDSVLADTHSPTKTRLYNLECWTYGADPSYGQQLVSAGLLPAQRAEQCPAEYARLRDSWNRLLAPYLK